MNSEERLSWGVKFSIIAVSAGVGLIQYLVELIPVVGNIIGAFVITPVAWLVFYMWFKMYGISFQNPKRVLALGGAGLFETAAGMIPFLSDVLTLIPAWTLAVLYIIASMEAKKVVTKI